MRVLLTADTCGGVLTWALELSSQLTAHGAEVELVTFGPPASPAQRKRIARAGIGAWHESDLALEWTGDPWDDLARSVDLLHELERSLRPDVVHLSSFGHAAAGLRAPVVITAHSDVWSWWHAVHGCDPPRSWDRYHEWVGAGLRAAAAVIAPTAAALADVCRAYGPFPGRSLVIPNAVRPPHDDAAANLPREPVALAAGRLWDVAKNAQALVRAAAWLPPGAVRLAGDPGGAPDLGPAIGLGELSANDLAAERRRAAVFAAPARYEPFGLAVLEAALDGCALVLGDITSFRELWDGVASFVDPDDQAGLVATIRSLIDDLPVARSRGAAARERALAMGGSAAFGRAHERLYEELAPVGAVGGR